MRIVGGSHKGRSLSSPPGFATRPTSDRARQAVFNILEHAPWRTRNLLEDADILDVFAGTGAMGLEALSRGGRHAAFIEQDAGALKSCTDNITALKEAGRTKILRVNAIMPPLRPADVAPRTLVFLDPPYGKGLGAAALRALTEKNWFADDAVCVLEMAKKQPEEIPAGFTQLDARDYGVARVAFLRRAA